MRFTCRAPARRLSELQDAMLFLVGFSRGKPSGVQEISANLAAGRKMRCAPSVVRESAWGSAQGLRSCYLEARRAHRAKKWSCFEITA